MSMNIADFALWLRGSEGTAGVIRGCTDEEILQVQTTQGVSGLPDDYHAFLRLAGRQAGELWTATEMFYPWLLKTKDWLLETLVVRR